MRRALVPSQSDEMPLRKGTAGAGFEVALEAERAFLIPKLEGYHENPWTKACGMFRSPAVVYLEPLHDIRGYPAVVARTVLEAADNVHEMGPSEHEASICNSVAATERRISRDAETVLQIGHEFCDTYADRRLQILPIVARGGHSRVSATR